MLISLLLPTAKKCMSCRTATAWRSDTDWLLKNSPVFQFHLTVFFLNPAWRGQFLTISTKILNKVPKNWWSSGQPDGLESWRSSVRTPCSAHSVFRHFSLIIFSRLSCPPAQNKTRFLLVYTCIFTSQRRFFLTLEPGRLINNDLQYIF